MPNSNAKKSPIKIIIISFVLVVIGFAIHMAMKKSERVATLKQAASSFALLDTSAIDKIILFNGEETVTLTKKQVTGWMYNGVDPANRAAIQALLSAMLKLKPLRPVPEKEMDKVAIALRSNGIKIQFYAGDIEDRAFYVNKSIGKTIMMMVSTGAPHEVVCEGYGDQVNQLFAANANSWKSMQCFTSTAKSIQSVICKSSTMPGYELQYDAGFYKLQGKDIEQQTIEAYFKKLLSLKINTYVPQNECENLKPILSIILTDVDDKRSNTVEVLKIESDKILVKDVKNGRFGYIHKALVDPIIHPKW